MRRALLVPLLAVVALAAAATAGFAQDRLLSWNDGPSKRAILEFVSRVTHNGRREFVPPAERIAVFDNDGTLWAEQPMYFQLAFALDRVKALAPQHPEWQEKEPFASLLKGDVDAALAGGRRAILDIVMATHAGMTTEEFQRVVKEWTGSAKHPKTGRLYTDMVYQPTLGRAGLRDLSDALLSLAKQNGWSVVSMKSDWRRIFPFERK